MACVAALTPQTDVFCLFLFCFFSPLIFGFRKRDGLIWIIAVSLLASCHFGDIMECYAQGDELIRNESHISPPPRSNLQAAKEKGRSETIFLEAVKAGITTVFELKHFLCREKSIYE